MNAFIKWLGNRFHNHEWEIHQELPLRVYDPYDNKVVAQGLRYVLRCKICGEVRFRDCK